MGMNRVLNGLAGLTGAGDPELQSPQQPANIAEPVTENPAQTKKASRDLLLESRLALAQSLCGSRLRLNLQFETPTSKQRPPLRKGVAVAK